MTSGEITIGANTVNIFDYNRIIYMLFTVCCVNNVR